MEATDGEIVCRPMLAISKPYIKIENFQSKEFHVNIYIPMINYYDNCSYPFKDLTFKLTVNETKNQDFQNYLGVKDLT